MKILALAGQKKKNVVTPLVLHIAVIKCIIILQIDNTALDPECCEHSLSEVLVSVAAIIKQHHL